MATKFTRVAFRQPTRESEVEPQPIRPATVEERFEVSAPADAPSGPTQPYGDARQDGRLDASLGDPFSVSWAMRFAAPLRPDTRAHSVMQHRDAVLVQAPMWQLFGLDGKARRANRSGSSPLVVVPGDRTFRWVNPDGYLASTPLDTGKTTWNYGLNLGDGATYPFVAARGDRVVVVGGERAINPEAFTHRVPRLGVEVIDAAPPHEVSPGGLLMSARSAGTLHTALAGDVCAAVDDDIVVAWKGLVLTAGFDLSVKRLLSGEFSPRSLSLGDAGRVYMVVRTAQGPRLWLLNRDGQRVFSAELPDDAADTRVPPLVSADQRVFVVTDSRVLAFSPAGDRLWEYAPPKGRLRAAVTADGWLMVTVDDVLGVFDADGNAATLYQLEGEVFCTAPVLTLGGEVFAATEKALVCIAPELDIGGRTMVGGPAFGPGGRPLA